MKEAAAPGAGKSPCAVPASDSGDILAFLREAGRDRWYRQDGAFDDEGLRRRTRFYGHELRPEKSLPGKRAMTAPWR